MTQNKARDRASTALAFGPMLSGAKAEPFRRHLKECFNRRVHVAVSVHTFFELACGPAGCTNDSVERPDGFFIVLDLCRLVLFHDSGEAETPGIASLVRFLEDGHPARPFDAFAAHELGHQYSFGFDTAVLEVVPQCLTELARGEFTVLDFLTGELLHARLHAHPRAVPSPPLAPAAPLQEPSPFHRVVVDRSLRVRPPPDLEGLVEHTAGVIRLEDLRSTSSSLALATCALSASRFAPTEYCYGKAPSPSKARAVARCEAAERFQVTYQQPTTALVRGSYDELKEHAVDPKALFFGRGPECPFDSASPICWTWAWGPTEQRWRLVPAQEVWFKFRGPEEPLFVHATTSGCAVGTTLEEAAIHGLLEAIERDGLLTAWYLRRPATEIDFASFDTNHLHNLLGRFRLALPAYRPVLFDLTSDIGVPTVGGLAIRESGSGAKAFVAAAAHVEPRQACARVLEDLMAVRLDLPAATLVELRARLVDVPRVPEAHFELYALDETFDAFDYLELGRRPPVAVHEIGRESPVCPDVELNLDLVLDSLAERFREVGAALYVKDITHRSLADYGLRAARVITPGLYPLWFGSRHRRLGITERLQRLALAYTGRPLDTAKLNLAPHPMS